MEDESIQHLRFVVIGPGEEVAGGVRLADAAILRSRGPQANFCASLGGPDQISCRCRMKIS